MASDLSSECTETIGALDEKEEGEISLEDVSSSEEGHLNYGYGTRVSQCSNCLSTQHNATWCIAPAKCYPPKGSNRREVDLILQDAVQGKENRHQINDSGCIGTKHTSSTLQEKNDDLVPISSDSDMEIVGLADNSKQIVIHSSLKTKMKKKRKKKRNHTATLALGDLVSSSIGNISMTKCVSTTKQDTTNDAPRLHHRETSPIHRSNRSRVISRSPPRKHRSFIRGRSPFKRSKSPIIRARSPTIRRSPRRFKSPKRSPYRSSAKTMPRKTSHLESASSHNYVNTHKLLKKVRQLDSVGTQSLEETLNKNKEHASSLKEKLSNILKGAFDNNSDFSNSSKEKSTVCTNKKEYNDADDEEDLALLRQKALETKQNKSSKQNDQPKIETTKNINSNINDDQDEEDLQLRMIALRSAVLKKHQNRVQKGIKSGKFKKSNVTRSESPFTQSFLDSIPIPGEELLNFASPPHTPVPVNENNHTEDMELDTDVEREKEKLPYSPTDKITANIPIDTELLGIQPSDVSFITLNEANNSPNFQTSITSSQDDQKSYQGKIIENRSYLPNIVYYTPSQNPLCATNTNMQYLQTNSTETSKLDFMKVHNFHANVHSYENTCNILKNNNSSEFVDINSSQEMPYSPTDTPVYDPDLSHALPQPLGPLATSNSSLVSLESYAPNIHQSNEQYNEISTTQPTQTTKQISSANGNEQVNKVETLDSVAGTVTTFIESASPTNSIITIDDLPETDAGTSPLTNSLKGIKITEHIPSDLSNSVKEGTLEPLYMKGIPDVTKDTNKIPTLINRTLVPATILKTNKQLQLPLPTKKLAVQQEPTFKSAEMQPVTISEGNGTKMNTSFKPIKLVSFPQKSHSIMAIPTAFHDSLHEDSTNEIPTDKTNTSAVDDSRNVSLVQNNTIMDSSDKTCDIKSPIQKKKKSVKKGLKRKHVGTIPLNAKKYNTLCAINDNIDTVDKQIHESDQTVHTNDKQNQKEHWTQADVKNKISLEANKEQIPSNETLSNHRLEQEKHTEDRRQSLDEDEEALRAILLASLTKRTKPTDNCSVSTTITTISTVSNQVITDNIVSKTVLPTVNTAVLSSSYGSENDKNQSNAEEKINNPTQGNSSAESVKTSISIVPSGRKKLIPMIRGPQKKLVKRISIPASTKVVNNAKKYQNAMIQRRLNLQKATLYNKQKMAENKIVCKVQSNDSKWSANTKTLSDTQSFVINLGSDTESDSEFEKQKNTVVSSANSTIVEKQQAVINSTAEFEKNLDQFLRAVRNKQESMAAARPTSISQTPKKDTVLTTKLDKSNSSNLDTPLAVRHLPASQQEEYRRLKQQILEREKLKLHRTVKNNNLIKNKNLEICSKPKLPSSPNKELPMKVNQTVPLKNQSVNAQQLNKENCSKNLIDSLKNINISTINVQSCMNKMRSIDKQGNTKSNETKTMSRSITDFNIRVSTENSLINIGNKSVGNSVQPINVSQNVFETATHKVQTKTKTPPGLKILSTDEVNRKYVQIQVKNDTNERVVTINDKVTLNNETAINRNENISESKDDSDKIICDYIQAVEKDISDIPVDHNNEVDSEASTIILSKEYQENRGNFDTSESTIRLSECRNSSSLISSTESKDDDHFLLLKPNLTSNNARSIEKDWEAIKKDVKTELNTLINLSRVEQEQRLMDTEQKLVMKRYTILDDLAEMSGNLRQWHMERDLQTNLVAEVKKLREQLKVAEERLQVQRNRINSIGPKVVAAHGKINAGRQECFKLATICSTLGSRIVGKEYKVPEAGAQLLDNRLKEVANHTRQLSRKKVPSIDIPEMYESSKLEEETLSTACTEISQIGDLSEGHSEDDVDTTILNENESQIKSHETEEAVQTELTTFNVTEASKEKSVGLNNSVLCSDERCTSQQSNAEVLTNQTNLNDDTSVATTSRIDSSDAQDINNKKAKENNVVRPKILKPVINSRNSTRRGDLQTKKKTLLPYESILTHFKVSRNTNPNGVLCPYELMGTCSDADCQFLHQTETQAK